MARNRLHILFPYPWRELNNMSTPPTAVDLSDVLKPLLEQCESLAAGLPAGLDNPMHRRAPECFIPTALLLQETLEIAVAVFTAWEQRKT